MVKEMDVAKQMKEENKKLRGFLSTSFLSHSKKHSKKESFCLSTQATCFYDDLQKEGTIEKGDTNNDNKIS